MNIDVLAELLLVLASLFAAWRLYSARPGAAIGIGLVGFAALLGIPDYLGMAAARGPHQFVSLVAAGAGLPLIGIAFFWPASVLAGKASAAAYFAVLAGGLSVAIADLLGFWWWSQLLPALSVMLLMAACLRLGRLLPILGAFLLAAAFVMSATAYTITPLTGLQQLHVLMGLALLLLGVERQGVRLHLHQKQGAGQRPDTGTHLG